MDNASWWRRRSRMATVALVVTGVVGGAVVTGLGGSRPDARRTMTAAPDAAPEPAVSASGAGAPGKGGRTAAERRAAAEAERVIVESSGSVQTDRRTMKVVSARKNLTGQGELAWVADAGRAVGKARCTQNFRIGQDATARERPTMLICWRTSATKSVYTLAIDVDKRPSEDASVDALTKAWEKLG